MTIYQAFILGIIQGLTEFLPVSSSGHLVITQTFLGISHPPLLFDVMVHVGSLIAVIIFFLSRLKKITLHLAKLTIIGTIPAAIVGLLIEPLLESIFTSLLIVGLGLIWTAILLASTKIWPPSKKPFPLTPTKSLIIGIFQAIAIMPGVSRSGSTISSASIQGISKESAFYFSFLLAIPAILGAMVLQLSELQSLDQLLTIPFIVGFLSATISGLFALRLLQHLIKSTKLHYFSVYCFLLGLGVLWANFNLTS